MIGRIAGVEGSQEVDPDDFEGSMDELIGGGVTIRTGVTEQQAGKAHGDRNRGEVDHEQVGWIRALGGTLDVEDGIDDRFG